MTQKHYEYFVSFVCNDKVSNEFDNATIKIPVPIKEPTGIGFVEHLLKRDLKKENLKLMNYVFIREREEEVKEEKKEKSKKGKKKGEQKK